MKILPTRLPEVLIIEPQRFGDERGFFVESFQTQRYRDAGICGPFVQDNMSRSREGVLRGLHYQIENPQGKLVQVVRGAVYDVAVDMRADSGSFGQWVGVQLTEENGRQLWVPPGFAHGFCVISPVVDFFYKCTDYYSPQHERSVRWDDPTLNISWPVANPVVSEKDQAAPTLDTAERFESCRMSQLLQQVDLQLTQSARTGGPGSTSKQPADSLT